MQQKTNIYVIIVTYNAMQWIDKCIVFSTLRYHCRSL